MRVDRERCLTPTQPQKPGKTPKIAAGDIESKGFGEYLDGDIYDGAIHHRCATPIDLLSLICSPAYRGFTLYFHNLQYDFRYLVGVIEGFLKEGWTFEETPNGQGRILEVVIWEPGRKNARRLRDSFALWPVPLASLHTMAGMEKLDIGLAEGTIYDPANPEHVSYLYRDTEMLYHAFVNYWHIQYDTFGVYPKITAGATAMASYRTTMTRPFFRERPRVEDFCRESIFGAMSYVSTVKKQYDGLYIDANAMYAHAMRQGVPIGSGCYVEREITGKPGIYRVSATVPRDVLWPSVPYRCNDKRLQWPIGEFDTNLDTITIALARRLGCGIEVQYGFVFEEIAYVFEDFIDKCETLEMANRGTALAQAVKFIRNNLYGKFGMKRHGKKWLRAEVLPDTYTFDVMDDGTIDETHGWIAETLERSYMLPHWAVFILANARAYLIDTIYQVGPDKVWQVDTDSIIGDRAAIERVMTADRIGTRYGQWKIEDRIKWHQGSAPKVYRYETVEGTFKHRNKGIPKHARLAGDPGASWDRALEQDRALYAFDSPASPWRVSRGEPLVRHIERKLSHIQDSVVAEVLPDGTVRPIPARQALLEPPADRRDAL